MTHSKIKSVLLRFNVNIGIIQVDVICSLTGPFFDIFYEANHRKRNSTKANRKELLLKGRKTN